MSVHLESRHITLAEKIVSDAHSHGGLAPVDLARFWEDQRQASSDPWAEDCPQLPLGIGMSRECVFAELGLEEDWWRLLHEPAWTADLSRQYNDLSERTVGRRLLSESVPDPQRRWPPIEQLHDIFEANNEWHNESYWLHQSADSEDELEALLDRVEERLADLRSFMLPSGWTEAKARLTSAGVPVPRYRGQRGPVTFACSVFGAQNLMFLILDNPDLAARFRDLILRAMLGRARVLDEEAGDTVETSPRGFYWCDDNCCLLSPGMYEFFGYPILKGVFDVYSPAPGDRRGQHSDSDMAHLLPILGRLGLTSCNFGPTLSVSEIREHLPRAVIHGQLAPFTFSRNEEVQIVAETLRDYEMSLADRGVVFATAGSINNGSRLTGLRLIMSTIQNHCRYV